MREDVSPADAELFKRERTFYEKRVAALRNAYEGLIAALERALPKITEADLRCAQARAHANEREVVLEDLEDARAVEIALLESSLDTSEDKAAKAAAHARSLMTTSKAQRSTISSLRASSERLIRRCTALEDAISTLSTRNDQLETMVHHLRIGIAKLASVPQAPSVVESVSVSDNAEELTKAVSAPSMDSEDRLDYVSYQNSLSDFVDEEECAGSSDVIPLPGTTESAAEFLLSGLLEEPMQTFDAEVERGEIQDFKPTDSLLTEAVADVLAPYKDPREPAPASSPDLSLYETFECSSEGGGSRDVTSTTCNTTEEVSLRVFALAATKPPNADLLEAADTFLRSVFAELAPSESCPLLTMPHGGEGEGDVSQLDPESPSHVDCSRTEDTLHHPSTSIRAPLGPSPFRAEPHKDTLLSEMIFRDASSSSPSSSSTDAPSEAGPLTPVHSTPSSTPFSQGYAYAFSPSRPARAGSAVAPHTPVCAFKGKVKAAITASTRKFLANKENSMPQAGCVC